LGVPALILTSPLLLPHLPDQEDDGSEDHS
jgi:hypothetical protein